MLGQLAGAAGPGQCGLPVAHARAKGEQADAGVETEGAPLPGENELLDGAAQLLGLAQRSFVIDFTQENGELVTADAGQLGMSRQLVRELGCQLPEQLVTGGMTTEVVDLLEAIQPQ